MNNNFFIFKVERKYIRVKLINHKDEILPNVKIEFEYGGKNVVKNTNNEGFCIFNFEDFANKEKVKARIHIIRTKKNGKKKTKIKKKTIKIVKE